MEKLEQNNLENATTDLGFVHVVNKNAEDLGTSTIALQREVELDDGTKVKVESVTPSKMKSILNEQANDVITFQTPGENFEKTFEEGTILGIAEEYNTQVESKSEDSSDEKEEESETPTTDDTTENSTTEETKDNTEETETPTTEETESDNTEEV